MSVTTLAVCLMGRVRQLVQARHAGTFAPNQVIKGWTAMQLMVQGEWRCTSRLGSRTGPTASRQRSRRRRVDLLMEIVKIKGETKPKQMTFPTWTPEELTLWLPKDEAAVVSWREARTAKWEAGDAKLNESYPTRAEFDAWLDKQSKSSKDKSLWKRTRTAKKKAAAAAAASAAPAAPAARAPRAG